MMQTPTTTLAQLNNLKHKKKLQQKKIAVAGVVATRYCICYLQPRFNFLAHLHVRM